MRKGKEGMGREEGEGREERGRADPRPGLGKCKGGNLTYRPTDVVRLCSKTVGPNTVLSYTGKSVAILLAMAVSGSLGL